MSSHAAANNYWRSELACLSLTHRVSNHIIILSHEHKCGYISPWTVGIDGCHDTAVSLRQIPAKAQSDLEGAKWYFGQQFWDECCTLRIPKDAIKRPLLLNDALQIVYSGCCPFWVCCGLTFSTWWVSHPQVQAKVTWSIAC